MLETLVRVKRWRNGWSVECWGLQHAMSFSQERAIDIGAQVVSALLARGDVARLVVDDGLGADSGRAA